MDIKLCLLLFYLIHLLKGGLLYAYNKRLNPEIVFSDFLMYVLMISPKLYIEQGSNNNFRKVILLLHYGTLLFGSVLFAYAILLVM